MCVCCDFVPDALQLQSIFAPCITLSFCSCSTLCSRTTNRAYVHRHTDEHDTGVHSVVPLVLCHGSQKASRCCTDTFFEQGERGSERKSRISAWAIIRQSPSLSPHPRQGEGQMDTEDDLSFWWRRSGINIMAPQ